MKLSMIFINGFQLMRNILHELFVVLGKEDWSDDSISCVIDIIKETVLDHSKDSIPDGIRTHVADIYLAELKKVVTNQVRTSDPILNIGSHTWGYQHRLASVHTPG